MLIRGMFGASLMVLAACSGNATGNTSAANTSATDAGDAQVAPAGRTADSGTRPQPRELKAFRNWTVGCDNANRCKATALAPEDGDQPAILMSVTREGGADGAVTVAILSTEAIPLPLKIAVDGKPVGEGGRTDDDATRIEGDLARRIVAAAVNGTTLTVADGGNARTDSVSLAGFSAALRYIDAEQGVVGTTSALVAKGPAQANPPARPLPTIVALTPGGTARKPTPAQIAEMNRVAQCELPDGMDSEPEVSAIGGGTTLVVLPCSAGAYNLIGALFLIGPDGVKPAQVDFPSGFDTTGADSQTPVSSVVTGGFTDGLLGSYAKGRGLGDCGVIQSYAWDGTRFRLAEQQEMGECRGSIDYVTTWRANVVRR